MARPYITYPYLATGGTVARTSPDRWGDKLDLKDFGAVGDGVANDQAAWQAAINAAVAAEKTLYGPPGTYLLGSRAGHPQRPAAGHGSELRAATWIDVHRDEWSPDERRDDHQDRGRLHFWRIDHDACCLRV